MAGVSLISAGAASTRREPAILAVSLSGVLGVIPRGLAVNAAGGIFGSIVASRTILTSGGDGVRGGTVTIFGAGGSGWNGIGPGADSTAGGIDASCDAGASSAVVVGSEGGEGVVVILGAGGSISKPVVSRVGSFADGIVGVRSAVSVDGRAVVGMISGAGGSISNWVASGTDSTLAVSCGVTDPEGVTLAESPG
ncbi:MAG: hypothetical protein JXO72_08085, partial [Vicinamibacteria bacterium]|nr:hypothetical protein [Vicinamibacteria bacterium]